MLLRGIEKEHWHKMRYRQFKQVHVPLKYFQMYISNELIKALSVFNCLNDISASLRKQYLIFTASNEWTLQQVKQSFCNNELVTTGFATSNKKFLKRVMSSFIAINEKLVPANVYLFKVSSNRNTREKCEICSKLTTETPERCQWLWASKC